VVRERKAKRAKRMHRQEYALHPNEWDGWGLPGSLKKERNDYRWKREDVWGSYRKENGGEEGDGSASSNTTTDAAPRISSPSEPVNTYRITGLALFVIIVYRGVTLLCVAAERIQKGNDGEKGDGFSVTRRYTTTDDAPRIHSHSEPIKDLPKHLTRSFSSPSPSLPLLYLYRPLVSLSEPLFLQDDHHGQNWTMVHDRRFMELVSGKRKKVCTRVLYFLREFGSSAYVAILREAKESGTQFKSSA
jgi:hypothetical protein